MNGLNFTTAFWSAPVVRHRCNVDDLGNLDTCVADGPDCGLTACARSLDIDLYLAETSIESCLGSILRCHLGCIRSVFLGAPETALTC